MMRTSGRARRHGNAGVTLALAVAALACGAGPAGAHGGDTTKIHACIVPSSGYPQIVGPNDTCAKNYRAQDWAAVDTNTTYTAGSGLALTGTVFSVTGAPWSGITGIPAGFADGVDNGGSWNTLADIPTGFADGVDNGGSWNTLADIPTGFADGQDDLGDVWSQLSGVPAGFADGDDDDGSAGIDQLKAQLATSDGSPNDFNDLVSFTKIKHLDSTNGGRILGSHIQDGTLQNQDIANGAIIESKLAGSYFGDTEATPGAVTSAKIRDGSIEPRDLGPGVVDRTITTFTVDPQTAPAGDRIFVGVGVPGLRTDDVVVVSPPQNLENDLVFAGSDVLMDGVLTIYLHNLRAAAVDGGFRTWKIRALRLDR